MQVGDLRLRLLIGLFGFRQLGLGTTGRGIGGLLVANFLQFDRRLLHLLLVLHHQLLRGDHALLKIRRTGVREVHGSFGGPIPGAEPGSKLGAMGFVPPELRDTDQVAVAEAVRILRAL